MERIPGLPSGIVESQSDVFLQNMSKIFKKRGNVRFFRRHRMVYLDEVRFHVFEIIGVFRTVYSKMANSHFLYLRMLRIRLGMLPGHFVQ
jgi:hypothetical protein